MLEKGSIVLSGGLTDFVPVTAGDRVEAAFDQLGTVVATAS
jgi:2-keto-4-pentenoate hydratase